MIVGDKARCIFCDIPHDSQTCVNAQTMPFCLKKRKILQKKACLACLKLGHVAKNCKAYVKCLLCQEKHVTLVCPQLKVNEKKVMKSNSHSVDEVHSQLNCTNEVLLQTLQCVIGNKGEQKKVRVLLDPGSQKSYILGERSSFAIFCLEVPRMYGNITNMRLKFREVPTGIVLD